MVSNVAAVLETAVKTQSDVRLTANRSNEHSVGDDREAALLDLFYAEISLQEAAVTQGRHAVG